MNYIKKPNPPVWENDLVLAIEANLPPWHALLDDAVSKPRMQ